MQRRLECAFFGVGVLEGHWLMVSERSPSDMAGALGSVSGVATLLPESQLLATRLKTGWFDIVWPTALAGGAYPIVLTVGFLLATIAEIIRYWLTGSFGLTRNLLETATTLLLLSTVGTLIGIGWAGIVCVAIISLVYLFARSLELRGNLVWLGGFTGGLTGFVAVMPPIMDELRFVHTWATVVFSLLIGPALTTVLGQLGGAWGAHRAREREKAAAERVRSLIELGRETEPVVADSIIAIDVETPAGVRFRIVHLMWIAVWLGLLLITVRLFGIRYRVAVPALLIWFVYQTLTLWAGSQLLRMFVAWRENR
jgi:hypothetical protein